MDVIPSIIVAVAAPAIVSDSQCTSLKTLPMAVMAARLSSGVLLWVMAVVTAAAGFTS